MVPTVREQRGRTLAPIADTFYIINVDISSLNQDATGVGRNRAFFLLGRMVEQACSQSIGKI